jgi:hypothetical protein
VARGLSPTREAAGGASIKAMTATTDITPELREEAVRRLRKKQDFRGHLLVYTLVNVVVWTIFLLTAPHGFPWPVFVTAGWGIGVVMNAWEVYGRRPITEGQIRHEIDGLRDGERR